MIKFSYKPLPAYILPNDIDYEYEKEKDKYTIDFIKKNNCNKYNPHTEYKEYWNGLNQIREKYGLKNIVQIECKCGYENNNKLGE